MLDGRCTSCKVMKRAVRLVRMAAGGQEAEHRARASGHVVVCVLGGDGPLFVAADFFAPVPVLRFQYGLSYIFISLGDSRHLNSRSARTQQK